MTDLFEYILIALACPLILPFINTNKEGERMTCEQCKYHSYIADTHFCDSRNHKRRTIRISREDTEKDMDCYWADEEGENE